MMRSTASIFAMALLLLGSTVHATIISPIGLPAGSPYQLIFVTANRIQATSGAESTYNTFVTVEAGL